MVLNGKNGGFFLDLDSSDAQPVTLDLGPDKEPEETTPEEPSSPMTLTVSKPTTVHPLPRAKPSKTPTPPPAQHRQQRQQRPQHWKSRHRPSPP